MPITTGFSNDKVLPLQDKVFEKLVNEFANIVILINLLYIFGKAKY
jgi:hypothetical protein